MTGAILVLCATSSARAADFGAKIGVTAAEQQTDAGIAADSRLGIRMGLFARWAVATHLNLTGEIGYTQRGARNAHLTEERARFLPNPAPGESDHRLDYLTIPIIADLSLQTGSVVLFSGAGPRVDILIGSALTSQGEGDVLGVFYDKFERFVFGFVVAGGIRSRDRRVSLEFQYNWDVSDSFSASEYYYFRSESLDVLFGFMF